MFNVAHAGVISDAPKISQVLSNALQFLLSVFGVLAIIGLIVAGILYLTAAGSEERMQKAKKAFIYSVIGIAISMGGIILIKTIVKFFS